MCYDYNFYRSLMSCGKTRVPDKQKLELSDDL